MLPLTCLIDGHLVFLRSTTRNWTNFYWTRLITQPCYRLIYLLLTHTQPLIPIWHPFSNLSSNLRLRKIWLPYTKINTLSISLMNQTIFSTVTKMNDQFEMRGQKGLLMILPQYFHDGDWCDLQGFTPTWMNVMMKKADVLHDVTGILEWHYCCCCIICKQQSISVWSTFYIHNAHESHECHFLSNSNLTHGTSFHG